MTSGSKDNQFQDEPYREEEQQEEEVDANISDMEGGVSDWSKTGPTDRVSTESVEKDNSVFSQENE